MTSRGGAAGPKTSKKKRSNNRVKTHADQILVRRIGLRIHKLLFESKRPVEWLAFKTGLARSSIREIIAGRSNPRILTLNTIAKGLGYKGVIAFLVALNEEDSEDSQKEKSPSPPPSFK